jgi:Ca2+-binding RTX toxin-like protein
LTDSFVVQTVDGTTQTVNITINGATDNQAPTDITLNVTAGGGGNSLPGVGAIGTFSTTDPDIADTFSYSLQAGSSAGFSITGNTLNATASLGETSTYTLNVQTVDSGGASFTETFNIITGSNSSADNPLPGGGSGNPILTGDDVLYGSGGNDFIFGGSGNDTIFGQNNFDTLVGGAGSDTISGGNQSDTFVFGNLAEVLTGVDTVSSLGGNPFNTGAPAANGDVLDIGDLIADFTGLPGTLNLTNLVASGHISFSGANANADTVMSFDSNGSTAGGTTGQLVVLQGVAFVTQAATTAALLDNVILT